MLSKLCVAGTTSIFDARHGQYWGARFLNTVTAGIMTVHDAAGTAGITAGNEVDRIQSGAAAGTLNAMPSNVLPNAVPVKNGLSVTIPVAGTATVIFN